MGKFAPGAEALGQIGHALLTAFTGIPGICQQCFRQLVLQVHPQLSGTVEVQQRGVVLIAQRQQPQALWDQNSIQLPDLRRQLCQRGERRGEDGAGFDPGQSRCALPHQIFLRHTVTSLPARTANGGSHGTSGTPV